MPYDFCKLPHGGIQTLHPYIPGKSAEELAREKGLTKIIKMASNENPSGCSPLARLALTEMSGAMVASYPYPTQHPIHTKLCEKLQVADNQLFLCNGSDLLFSLLLTAFALHIKKSLLIHDYSFMSYRIQAQTLGIPVISTPLLANWEVDIEAMIKSCTNDVGLIFIANPNNPTGVFLPEDKIKYLLDNIPESTLVLIDEAYYEFAYPKNSQASLALLHKYPNLLVSRTFSKAYGLAGLRLGYAIANPQIIEVLWRIQPPFSVNQAALNAACAALDDENFIDQTVTINEQGKQQILEGLNHLKLSSIPSATNFITFDCGRNSLPIYEGLLQHGIIVRPLTPYAMPNHLRVSIGKPEHNRQFLTKLATCLCKEKENHE